jgi:GNAT superfamily N-acetyltransferase
LTTTGETIERVLEMGLRASLEKRIADLLDQCFPNTFEGRSYYKQVPHSRLLLRINRRLIGHAGLDHRVIRVGETVIRVTGIVDLCVDPDHCRVGRGSTLLTFAESIARRGQTDHMILFADRADLYVRNGYRAVEPAVVTWLAIDERASHSMQRRDFSGTFMVKALSDEPFPGGEIDLLGYLF